MELRILHRKIANLIRSLTRNSKFIGSLASLIDKEHQESFKNVFITLFSTAKKKLSNIEKNEKNDKKETDDPLVLFSKRFRSMSLDRNEAIQLIEKSHLLVDVFKQQQENKYHDSTLGPNPYLELYNKVQEFWKRFVDYMVIFSSSKIDLDLNGGLKKWNELIKKWGQDYRSIFKKERDTTYIHMMVYHTGDMIKRLGSLQRFGCFSLESKHIVTNEIHQHQTNNSNFSGLEVLSHHLLCEKYQFPIPARENHRPWYRDLVKHVHDDLRKFIAIP